MDRNGGVKVTYIETQFVTSDAASFKSLVQRLTGKSAGAVADPLHRPRPCRADGRSAAADTGTSRGYYTSSATASMVGAMTTAVAPNGVRAAAAPACVEEMNGMRDFSELFYGVGGATERRHGGSYRDFPY